MTNKKKLLIIIIGIIAIISTLILIYVTPSQTMITQRQNYSIAIHANFENSFVYFLPELKNTIQNGEIDVIPFSSTKALQEILENAEKHRLLAAISPITNDTANMQTFLKKKLLAPLPEKNTITNTYAALQRTLQKDNDIWALAIAYDPYIMLSHITPIADSTFAPMHIAGSEEQDKLASAAWVTHIEGKNTLEETLETYQTTEIIQKNPISYSITDIFQIFEARLTEEILIPFSYFYTIPKNIVQQYTVTPTTPFIGSIYAVLFPAYIEETLADTESTYIKTFDYFASLDFQFAFADAQNYLPARIESIQRNRYSDAMRTFLLREGTFVNIGTQYENEKDKDTLLTTMKKSLTTTNQSN